jgi:hypothetical protein
VPALPHHNIYYYISHILLIPLTAKAYFSVLALSKVDRGFHKHQNKHVNNEAIRIIISIYLFQLANSMPQNVVGDPTDPRGTLRPNLQPEIGTGDHYEAMFCPEFDRIINLPLSIDRTDPLALWSLFFTPECLWNIVQNTNKKGGS